ncbi:MAG: calcium/sodium antiporter [SAR86 cluster bacterium]|uniref:Calcium/sodium antiporter n=1 Tax=SAR86 cluster bacterium TaxID=2030880 RepID=A0A2A4MJP5_9GAMM|nr:MAG: calcium/sodium antiporter [SAR86 cluster bacterium]
MLVDVVIIVLGFIGLIWGADKFVFGASAIARNLGISPLMIGLTIVAFGTSAPEIFSSAVSALEGKPQLAIGNAIGSNIFNIGVALGVAALIRPLKPPKSLFSKEMPALLLVTVVTGLLLCNLYLGGIDAIILILITIFFGYKLFKKKSKRAIKEDVAAVNENQVKSPHAIAYLVLGLVLLILSAQALVTSATSVAESLGVSMAVIGLTVVALGTSLPELAASVTCALKGHHEIAIGNIVGSNILNLLAVLPFPGLISPSPIDSQLLFRDYGAMLLLTLCLCLFCYLAIKRNKSIGRLYGAVFLLFYCGWFTVMAIQI